MCLNSEGLYNTDVYICTDIYIERERERERERDGLADMDRQMIDG